MGDRLACTRRPPRTSVAAAPNTDGPQLGNAGAKGYKVAHATKGLPRHDAMITIVHPCEAGPERGEGLAAQREVTHQCSESTVQSAHDDGLALVRHLVAELDQLWPCTADRRARAHTHAVSAQGNGAPSRTKGELRVGQRTSGKNWPSSTPMTL